MNGSVPWKMFVNPAGTELPLLGINQFRGLLRESNSKGKNMVPVFKNNFRNRMTQYLVRK